MVLVVFLNYSTSAFKLSGSSKKPVHLPEFRLSIFGKHKCLAAHLNKPVSCALKFSKNRSTRASGSDLQHSRRGSTHFSHIEANRWSRLGRPHR